MCSLLEIDEGEAERLSFLVFSAEQAWGGQQDRNNIPAKHERWGPGVGDQKAHGLGANEEHEEVRCPAAINRRCAAPRVKLQSCSWWRW